MSSSSKLRLLRRRFLSASESAKSVFNTGEIIPGQTPDKLFADAEEYFHEAITAYTEVLASLDERVDEEKIEQFSDTMCNLEQNFDHLKQCFSRYYQQYDQKLEHQTAANLNFETRSNASCSSVQSSTKLKLELQRKKVRLQQSE